MRNENCMKCYPRMCQCTLTEAQRIEALLLCLASSLWDEFEQLHHRRRLTKLIPDQEQRTQKLQECLISENYGDMEKERLQKELNLVPQMQEWLEL